MRIARILLPLALLGLVAGGLGAAFAQPTAAATPNDRPCAPAAGAAPNATFAQWRVACVRNMTESLRFSIESFNENRTLILAKHEANLSHVHATFFDGKIAALQECLATAAPYGRNASGPHGGVLASCLHEKMPVLRQAALASHQAERQSLLDALRGAKDAAKAGFAAQRDAWLAANPRP